MRHFLDHNAGAPIDPRVLECMVAVERECPGNPASLHGPGRHARAVVEAARAQIASALAVPASSVLFTSGGTEANNLAVLGLGPRELPVLHSAAEHPSVARAAESRGAVLLPVDASGQTILEAPQQRVGLLCLVHGQSEVGTLQPVVEAAALSKRLGVKLFVDAAQTLGRVPLGEAAALSSALALSPHKAGGPRGVGVLIVREASALRPLLHGGGQEQALRPGTQSPALCAAAALAIALAVQERQQRAATMAAARAAFLSALEGSATVRVLTPMPHSLPNTLCVHVPLVDGRSLLPALDLAGVEASQGAACSSGSPTPPAVLSAMGLELADARACVRFSFGYAHDGGQARDAGRQTASVIARLQKKF
ncbi:MAG TPA: aminotransferase class V-fold PLP-dependent enzyme [Planctomycetota bacterium]|nr:aminotransferase class V-fold PLP-dependent enzyme [Planctomycetota bacterium]